MATPPSRLIGASPAFLRVLDEASLIAPLDKPALIVGERGTGKELIAERVHYLSSRWSQPFLKMNCAAISESLLESELFGHEAGSFTGAVRAHAGRFERANGGTLFLDELASTSPLVQEKILRLIEYGEFERLGGSKTQRVDVRLIAATNEDLPALADRGRFRHDLLDRIAFDVITLPPLRARHEDIMLLAEHFAVAMASTLGRDLFPGFTTTACATLEGHGWPGNVRELKNVVERSVYRAANAAEPVSTIVLDPFDSPHRPSAGQARPANVAVAANRLPMDLKTTVRDLETSVLQLALEQARHNQRKAAPLLGLTYHQLRGYLRKYQMVGPGADAGSGTEGEDDADGEDDSP